MAEPDSEPYRRPGRRRRRGPGRSFYDWAHDGQDIPAFIQNGSHVIEALQAGDVMLAQGLLLAKADPNIGRTALGWKPLHWASAQGLVGLCRQLIRHTAELDAGTHPDGLTSLHVAVLNGHHLVLKMLLEAQASTNVISISGESPLSLSVNDGNIENIQLLLTARAKVDIPDEQVHDDGVHGSRRSNPGSPKSSASTSSLYRAVHRDAQKELVEELVDAGANLEVTDPKQNRPLHVSIRHGNSRVARLLLDSRADPNACNEGLQTPMHCAAQVGLPRAVKMLVDKGAELNCEDTLGMTPLQVAGDPVVQLHLSKLGGKPGLGLPRSASLPSLGADVSDAGTLKQGGVRVARAKPRPLVGVGGAVKPSPLSPPGSKSALSSFKTPSSPTSPTLIAAGMRLPGVAWG